MPLIGQVTGGDVPLRTETVKGRLAVYGLVSTQGELTLTIGAHELRGQLSSDGVLSAISGPGLDGRTATHRAPRSLTLAETGIRSHDQGAMGERR